MEESELGFEIVIADIDDLESNDYNPNLMEKGMFELLVSHLKEEGKMVQPILVRKNPLDGGPTYMVVDGENRYKAARMAGIKNVAVVVMDYSEDEAKFKTISMNQLRGNYIPLRMAKLLVDLQERYSMDEIRKFTGIVTEGIVSLTKLLEVPDIDFGNSSIISMDTVDRPVQVTLMLMPDEICAYKEAMDKAMQLSGKDVTPLLGDEVGQYDYAMSQTMGISGIMLRNIALSLICKTFNKMDEVDREKLVLSNLPELVEKKMQKDVLKKVEDSDQSVSDLEGEL